MSLPTWDTISDGNVFDYGTFTHCGAVFQLLHLTLPSDSMLSLNPLYVLEFRLVPFRSPLLRESLLLSFPLVTKMFQFTRFALSSLCIQEVVLLKFPYSGIFGSKLASSSPKRIVGSHALHRF